MCQKNALFVLNPFSHNEKNKNRSWLFESFGLNSSYLVDLDEERENPKLLLREIGIGKKIIPDKKQLLSFLEQGTDNNPVWKQLIAHLEKEKSVLHIILPLLDAKHFLQLLIKHLPLKQRILIHLVIPEISLEQALKTAEELQLFVDNYEKISFGTLIGEKSIFNQKNNWQETQKSYDEIVFDQTQTSFSVVEYLKKQQEREISPENIAPVSFVEAEPLENKDIMLILECDSEKIELITQAFEISKNEQKKSDFSSFPINFITKELKNCLIITVKKPYDSYENVYLIENEQHETLANKLAKQEYRQLHLADHQHLKLITKYLNNEAEIFYDGQKNKACDPLFTEEGCCVQTANETLVKTYKKELENFETFFLAASFSEKEDKLLKQLISLSQEKEIWIVILDFLERKIRHSAVIWQKEKEATIWELKEFLITNIS